MTNPDPDPAKIRELCEDEARRLGYADLTDAETHGDGIEVIAESLGLSWPGDEPEQEPA